MDFWRAAFAFAVIVVLQPQACAEYINQSDLTTKFMQSNAVGEVGATIKLFERTTNVGNETAPSSSTMVESMPDGVRTWLHKPQIKGYAFREDSFNYTCSIEGYYELVSVADYYGTVNETNESNNRAAMTVHCFASSAPKNKPDLSIGFEGGEVVVKPGTPVRLHVTVRNTGTAPSGNTTTQLLFPNGTRLQIAELPFEVGEHRQASFGFECSTAGDFTISASADAGETQNEFDESNNYDVLTVKCGTTVPLPDLKTQFQPSRTIAFVGGRVSLFENTSNAGGADAPESVTAVRLPDGALRRFNKPALGPGAFKTDFVTVECVKPGALYAEAIADYPGRVPESNEEANSATARVDCVIPGYSGNAGLFSEFLDSNLTAFVGESIALHERTANKGDTSPPSKTRVWWARGIKYYDNPPLANGEGRTSDFTFTCVEAGVFTVSSLADSDFAVPEENEDDNRAAVTVTCRNADGSVPSAPEPQVGFIPKFILEPPKQLPALDLLTALFRAINNILSSLGK